MSNICQTQYPILMLHGAGFRDSKRVRYWGRIPSALAEHGAVIYYGGQDSWATVEQNARVIKSKAEQILAQTGSEKINIIAHSKGGLEARYLISTLKMGEKIASLTTLSTPHHGSQTMDRLYRIPQPLFRCAAGAVNLWFRLIGDNNPDFYPACAVFTTQHMKEFNRQNKNAKGVYYQSFAAAMEGCTSDVVMMMTYFFIRCMEGENDGLVTPRSARWGDFRGVLRGASHRGVSHADVVDLRRRRLLIKTTRGDMDLLPFYISLVSDLKRKGF